ncbi:hypothetical protein IFM89_019309 [Coptis chinensis]|uniref:Transcription initiation factor TFIID subunit 8 n=1 Tax=Coptis chinensis TaxID=261450 RepID=A0A835IDS5_9MAGN|nr:hypothetical protein IFM89_019309 [Coptis chinensis]
MNNGGGENVRDNNSSSSNNNSNNNQDGVIRKKGQGSGGGSGSGSDDYGRAITKIAVAQICESVGFQCFQHSALEVLSEVAVRYLRDLGKTAHFYANVAGRSDCNVFDIVQGLEDLVSSQGFSGASDVNHSISSSVVKDRKPTPSFLQIGEVPDKEHIPAWLPAFPDPHTYVHTPVWKERKTDPRADKIAQARQRRKEEQSLFNLQRRLACNGSSAFASANTVDDGKAKQVVQSNPFLAPPLQSGEKEVSPVVPPAKLSKEPLVNSRNSVLDAFAPAIGTANTGLSDSKDDDRMVLPNKRPILNFQLGVSKKSLGLPVDLTLQNKLLGETTQLIGRGDEKDDKKRRAEQILKESMENSRELS